MFRVHAFSSNIRDSFTPSHPPKGKIAVEMAVKIASVKGVNNSTRLKNMCTKEVYNV